MRTIALHELALRDLEESRERGAEHMPSRSEGSLTNAARAMLRSVSQPLERAMKFVLFVAIVYVCARLFGGDSELRMQDTLESRVALSWECLVT